MKYIKLYPQWGNTTMCYENFDWSDEDFDYEEEKILTLINNLKVMVIREDTLIVKVFLKDWNRFKEEIKPSGLKVGNFDEYLKDCKNFIYVFIERRNELTSSYMTDSPYSIKWTFDNYKNNGYYDYSTNEIKEFDTIGGWYIFQFDEYIDGNHDKMCKKGYCWNMIKDWII